MTGRGVNISSTLIAVCFCHRKYVKEQKEHKDEISRASGSLLDKVREETIALRQALALVSNSIQRDGCSVENLKIDVSKVSFLAFRQKRKLTVLTDPYLSTHGLQGFLLVIYRRSLSQLPSPLPQCLEKTMSTWF